MARKKYAPKPREEVVPLQPECIVEPLHEPSWDKVHRNAGQDDFALVTKLAHLFWQIGSRAKIAGKAVYTCLMGAIQSAQMHWHYETCKKNGHDGNDESCRLEQPRLIVNKSR